MRPWNNLPDTYKRANEEQARYAVEILLANGFDIQPINGQPTPFPGFTPDQIETMAELEHGRWNIERLRDGWRPGRPRDNAKKLHDCLTSRKDQPEHVKEYDRCSVRSFPEILLSAQLQIVGISSPKIPSSRSETQ
jgi:hypothetical protein